jgi:hypothetical protein
MFPFKIIKCKALPLVGLKCSFVMKADEWGFKPHKLMYCTNRIKGEIKIFQNARSLQSLINWDRKNYNSMMRLKRVFATLS